MPRKRHVSRNLFVMKAHSIKTVMPRKRHVSRNLAHVVNLALEKVMPRKRHVSRNFGTVGACERAVCHASQEACE